MRAPPPVQVDVIVNNHNYARFLGAAIDSAIAQTHRATRVIVVDDGSTDGSAAIISAYGERIHAVMKTNGGQASAFNAGFAESAGDVVIFLDADDMLLPDAVATVAAVFADAPSTAKVQYRMRVIDASGRSTQVLKPPPHVPLPNGDVCRRELESPFDLPWVPTSGTAFNAAYLRRVLPMPAGSPIGADWYVTHLAPLWGPVRSLEVVGALYRVHGGNAYEPDRPVLHLGQLRQTIRLADSTRGQLERFANELGVDCPRRITAVSDVANRLISLKLDPAGHPLPGDRLPSLLVEAVRATSRRRDVRLTMRLLFLAWFGAMVASPRRSARPLAELFMFPEERRRANRVLGRLHGGRRR